MEIKTNDKLMEYNQDLSELYSALHSVEKDIVRMTKQRDRYIAENKLYFTPTEFKNWARENNITRLETIDLVLADGSIMTEHAENITVDLDADEIKFNDHDYVGSVSLYSGNYKHMVFGVEQSFPTVIGIYNCEKIGENNE